MSRFVLSLQRVVKGLDLSTFRVGSSPSAVRYLDVVREAVLPYRCKQRIACAGAPCARHLAADRRHRHGALQRARGVSALLSWRGRSRLLKPLGRGIAFAFAAYAFLKAIPLPRGWPSRRCTSTADLQRPNDNNLPRQLLPLTLPILRQSFPRRKFASWHGSCRARGTPASSGPSQSPRHHKDSGEQSG